MKGKIKIQRLESNDKNAFDDFRNKEWKKFNLKNGYKWNMKKYSFIAKPQNSSKDNFGSRKSKEKEEDFLGKEKILGLITFEIVGGVGYISEIIVADSARRYGIGDLLIKKFEDLAKKEKCHLLYLETSEIHSEALKLYKKHNYKIKIKLYNNKFHFKWYLLFKTI